MAGLRSCDDMGDTYAAADATMYGWSSAPNSVQAGYVGGSCFRWANNNGTKTLPVTSAEWTFGFHWKPTTGTTAFVLLTLLEGATTHVKVSYLGDGTWTVDRNGTVLTTSAGGFSVPSGTWATVEFYCKIDDANGAYELRLNGVKVLDNGGVGKDTRNGGTGLVGALKFISPASAGTMDVDDLWYDDTVGGAFRGDIRAIGSVANAAGTYAQWTPNASTNISRVNQATPDGDTTYNSSATPNQIDSFGHVALPVGAAATVHGVLTRTTVRKDDAAGRTIANFLRRGGNDYVSATSAGLASTYVGYEDFRTQDPSTGPAAWTVAGVDAGEYGYKEIT